MKKNRRWGKIGRRVVIYGSMDRESDISRVWTGVLLAVLLLGHAAGGSLFLLLKEESPPSFDPAYHFTIALDHYEYLKTPPPVLGGNWVENYLNVSTYYPPAFHTLAALACLVAGPSVTVVRFVSLFLFLVLILLTFELGRRYASRRAGLIAAFLIGSYPICIGYSRVIYLDLPTATMVALSLLLLEWSRPFDRLGRSIIFGLSLALGMMTKWLFGVLFLGPVLWAIGRDLLGIERGDVEKAFREILSDSAKNHVVNFLLIPILLWLVTGYVSPDQSVSIAVVAVYYLGAVLLFLGRIMSQASERFSTNRNERLLRFRNFFVVILTAISFSLPWYMHHFKHIVQIVSFSLVQAADPSAGMVPATKEPGILYYFVRMESYQMQLVYFLLFWVSMLGLRKMETRRKQMPLLFSFLVGFVILSLLSLKYPRYGICWLVYAALFCAVWVDSLEKPFLRRLVVGLIVLNGLVLYYGISYGLPLVDPAYPVLEWRTRLGDWTIYGERGPGNHVDFSSDWYVPKISKSLVGRAKMNRISAAGDHSAVLLANHTFIHFHAFNVYSRLAGSTLNVVNYRDDFPEHDLPGRILNASYVIEKEGKDLGPEFSLGRLREGIDTIHKWDLLGPRFFRIISLGLGIPQKDGFSAYKLPDGDTLKIYENLLWSDRDLGWESGAAKEYRFEGGIGLRKISVLPIRLPTCRAVLVEALWDKPNTDPDDLNLFFHLYGPKKDPSDCRDTTDLPIAKGRFLSDDDPEAKSRYRYLFFFRGGVPDNDNYAGLGLFYPSGDHRLKCLDVDGNRIPDDIIILDEPFSFESE